MRLRFLLTVTMLTILSSCEWLGFNTKNKQPDLSVAHTDTQVRGSGVIARKWCPITGPSEIIINGPGQLDIVPDETISLSVEADDNILPLLNTEFDYDSTVLRIFPKPNVNLQPSQTIKYRLTINADVNRLRDLHLIHGMNAIKIDGSYVQSVAPVFSIILENASSAVFDKIIGDKVNISLKTASSATIDSLVATKLATVELQHASSLTISSGDVTKGLLTASHASRFVAPFLDRAFWQVDLSSAAQAQFKDE